MGKRVAIETGFPNRLRVLREDIYDWSKSEAARQCGVGASLYGRYEAGSVEPTLSNILKLMKGFKVDFLTLIGEKTLNLIPSGKDPSSVA